jgi:oxygen-dependent protoporphyrinogen oxidase
VTEPTADAHVDVIIVGGGLAGLYAAHQLLDESVLILEADDRPGGRIKSHRRGELWANVGAHTYPSADSLMGRLADDLGLVVVDIPGSLRAIASGTRILTPPRMELLPFLLPLRIGQRIAFAITGLKLAVALRAFDRLQRRVTKTTSERRERERAVAHFEADRSFADFLGRIPSGIEPLIRALSRRLASEPEQLSAGAALTALTHVMGSPDGPGATARVVEGGTERLVDELVSRVGGSLRLGAIVTTVDASRDDVIRVTYRTTEGEQTVTSDAVILATPAAVTQGILEPRSPELAAALEAVRSGPYVSVAIFTSETAPATTDGIYAITTPGLEFDFLFNHAQPVHARGGERRGGAFMAYQGGPRAVEHFAEDDATIAQRFVDQFLELLPEYHGLIAETHVQRWPLGTYFAAPGRVHHQAALEAGHPDPRVALAGDYLSPISGMEAAARGAHRAVERIRPLLANLETRKDVIG